MVDVTEHLKLVHWILTKRFAWAVKGRIEYDDLFQAGCMGLMRAAEKFEPERGFAFTTYAMPWVVNFICRHIQWHGRLVRVPLWAQEAKRVGPERVQYLDAPKQGEASGYEFVGEEDPEFEQVATRVDVDELVELLPERLRRVVRLRLRGYTFEEIARDFGCTRERTRQMEQQALKEIQKRLRRSGSAVSVCGRWRRSRWNS